MIDFALRALEAHIPKDRTSVTLVTWIQTTYATGFISMGQCLVQLLQSLLEEHELVSPELSFLFEQLLQATLNLLFLLLEFPSLDFVTGSCFSQGGYVACDFCTRGSNACMLCVRSKYLITAASLWLIDRCSDLRAQRTSKVPDFKLHQVCTILWGTITPSWCVVASFCISITWH